MDAPIGTFNCKLDAKGRLMLPSNFREQLGCQTDEEFVLRPGLHDDYLELYTINDWNHRIEILKKRVNVFDPKQVNTMRKYLDGVRLIKLDSSGRLLIPKDLLERQGIGKEVVIGSILTNMEIWDKTKYDKCVNTNSDEDLAKDMGEMFKEEK